MMPDLGKYAVPVLASYAATLVLIAVLVGASLWRSARMRRTLRAAEDRQGGQNG
jgi:heme exporter protein D